MTINGDGRHLPNATLIATPGKTKRRIAGTNNNVLSL
jgi:hypothetical protein